MALLHRSGTSEFFNFSSEQDPKDSAQEIAGLDQGGLGLPDRDYYFKTDQKSVDLRAAYLTHVAKMFELLGSSPADAAKKAQVVMAIETALADGSFDLVTRRDPEKVYHKMTVKELAMLGPDFDWAKFLKGVGAPPIQSLDVSVPPFIKALNAVIDKNSLDDLKTYLSWHLAHSNTIVLPTAFQQEDFNFYGKVLRGAKEMRPRWKRCVDLTDGQLPDALGRAFVEKTLGPQGTRANASDGGGDREVDGEGHSGAGLDVAQDQATGAGEAARGDQQDRQQGALAGLFHRQGDSRRRLRQQRARASAFELARQLGKIGKPVDKTDWEMSQPTVNAYYDPQENDINFPAGILQPPFYDNKMDDAVNYGGIGAVIGHELTHAFDDQGRQYDDKGNLRDWWTEADAKAFDALADCLVKQYGGYTAVDDVKVNGKLTLGENTADNGGLRISYMALMDLEAGKQPAPIDGFTEDQRFFLGWAQVWCQNQTPESLRQQALTNPHSPSDDRVNGAVSNMPEFRKAFSCKEGSPMAPVKACRVW